MRRKAVGVMAVIVVVGGGAILVDLFRVPIGSPTARAADVNEVAATDKGASGVDPNSPDSPQMMTSHAEIPSEDKLLQMIGSARQQLEIRERELQARERQLETLQLTIEKRLIEMKELRVVLENAYKRASDERQQEEDRVVLQLTKIMQSAKSREAALILAEMDEELAIKVLARMQSRVAGKVLGQLPTNKAARLSEKFAEVKKINSVK